LAALEAKEQLVSYLKSDYLDDRKVVNAIIAISVGILTVVTLS
jgi:hypothetical protein